MQNSVLLLKMHMANRNNTYGGKVGGFAWENRMSVCG